MKDNSTAQLLPCPWCNGPADIGEDDGTHDVVFGFCTRCAAQGPWDPDGDREEAARLWNTRAPVSQDVEQLVERLLEELDGWEQAYPLSAFPEPDLKMAAALLKAGGMTLDAVSASNMRHVVCRLAPKVRETIEALTRPQPSTSSVEAVAREVVERAVKRLKELHDYAGRPAWEQVVAEEIRAAIAALPSPEREPMREAWQPIERAPKDGRSILAIWQYDPNDPEKGSQTHEVVRWLSCYWESNEGFSQPEPSHWMPLPAPPTAQSEKVT